MLLALRGLELAMQQQYANADDGLLADVVNDAPRLYPRVDRRKKEYRDLLSQVSHLREQFDGGLATEEAPNFSEIRQRLGWLVTALRHHQSRENDLIFEAVDTDLGALD